MKFRNALHGQRGPRKAHQHRQGRILDMHLSQLQQTLRSGALGDTTWPWSKPRDVNDKARWS
jgi:hypothetical protein